MQVALQPRGLAAEQFAGVGILLLRHQRGAGAEGVGQLHELELGAAPEDQVLGDARQVHAEQRARRRELDEDVAIGDGVHGVLRDLRPALGIGEAQRLRGKLAVDRQRGAGDGPGAQRAPVGLGRHLGKTPAVAVEHLEPREQVMRQVHRLRPLQVCVAGNEDVAVRPGHGQQRPLGAGDFFTEYAAGKLEPQPHVGRDLVVPAPRGVELGRSGHALRQRLLDVHVNVLELGVPGKLARRDLGVDGIEPGVDGIAFLGSDEADVREHGRVGLAAGDVKRRQAAVERDGLAELQH